MTQQEGCPECGSETRRKHDRCYSCIDRELAAATIVRLEAQEANRRAITQERRNAGSTTPSRFERR